MVEDFKHIVRIASTNLDGNRRVEHALAQIKGVGKRVSTLLVDHAGIDRNSKIGKLSDNEIEKLEKALLTIEEWAPIWTLNRKKDYETGKDKHLTGAELELTIREDINLLKKIRSYKGIRHEKGLSVRGQKTRANKRKGLAVGVSRKKARQK
jgi:small subunit ribosomal protein S13